MVGVREPRFRLVPTTTGARHYFYNRRAWDTGQNAGYAFLRREQRITQKRVCVIRLRVEKGGGGSYSYSCKCGQGFVYIETANSKTMNVHAISSH